MATEVEAVQSLAEKIELGRGSLPDEYVREETERAPARLGPVPIIDVSLLHGDDAARRSAAKQIGAACREWGIFVAVNHGIPREVIRELKEVGEAFFALPAAEKQAYAAKKTPGRGLAEGYATAITRSHDGKLEWCDFYYHFLAPPSSVDHRFWPRHDPRYRKVTETYGEKVKEMIDALMEALDEDLGVAKGSLANVMGGKENLHMEMKINYYPRCPEPNLALGVEPHSDMGILTLIVSNGVPGLHVRAPDGSWVYADNELVEAEGSAIIVHVGDQLHIASNGAYHSVVHRSVVSDRSVRLSWPVFCVPPMDAVVGPLPQLLQGEPSPSPSTVRYTPLTYVDYQRRKLTKKL